MWLFRIAGIAHVFDHENPHVRHRFEGFTRPLFRKVGRASP
jgi:hypothetical protein